MNVKVEYGLIFRRINHEKFGPICECQSDPNIEGSFELSDLLNSFSNQDIKYVQDEVNNAIRGVNVEEEYLPDTSSTAWITLMFPNAMISDQVTITLLELKELLEEWRQFLSH